MPEALECDLLVIGSGAAGLCAAVTGAIKGLDVIVAERAAVLGGTTAWSGGWMWLPRNALARAAGIDEPLNAPRSYLADVLGNRFDPERIDAFLSAAPDMVDFLTEHGFVFEAGNRICDIYGDRPGAGTGGRSLIAARFDARRLGKRIALLRETKRETAFAGMPIQAGPDLAAFLTATRKAGSAFHAAKRVALHLRDLLTTGRAMHLVNGVALIARLFELGDRHAVRWLTGTSAVDLIARNGRVVGARLASAEGRPTVIARKGVVLATGGFSSSADWRSRLFPHPALHETLTVPEADGSGAALAQAIGGTLSTEVAATGAWCPVSRVTWPDGTCGVFPHIVERGKPGVIAVLQNGRRFVNEANGYHDFIDALFSATAEGDAPRAWLVCDDRFLRRWGLGIVKPDPVPASHWRRTGYLKSARSVEALARLCGIERALLDTVDAYNRGAREGLDPEFGRGGTPYNRYQGDPDRSPNPNVAPIEHGPFHAVEVIPGSFGSFAGLRTNGAAQVLDQTGTEIAGLYAAGADAASLMGGHYPAGGINLGPAMCFGYIAALHAAGAQVASV
ncbi:succinate dehydrogenase/fumarate reductase flavoprotein subunit [Novosphingobium kunmingense]|uniref:Succinate dehydrogenase/fumarate reductase flavoprotein subunit n=1 Tax=Novosphingobium kunmingense TaxID=1211806 RepID=A0A2N0H3J5_9SPHN|nr:FAD-dependent oxidoreductase [Novosphingobium kunmingense]PKB13498.1 succinate dehydrogenase/fumarate reductase flavoprotein subunit [Novosphingobium kunmingense]